MFHKNENGDIVLEIQEKKYNIEDSSDYMNLVIYLTDPMENAREYLSSEDLAIDSSLEEEDERVCKKYRKFLIDFEESRRESIMSKK